MTRRTRRNQGFTLIEMMVSVAIIGVLAATSVALFRNYQLRARMSEAKSNLASIRDAQKSYFAERSRYEFSPSCPGLPGHPTNSPQNWKAVRTDFCPGGAGGFDVLGWQPEGAPLFDYDTAVNPDGQEPRFTAAAYGDVDGDGALSVVLYVQPDSAGNSESCGVCGGLGLPDLPWDPVTCDDVTNRVAQMPSSKACGHGTVADDF